MGIDWEWIYQRPQIIAEYLQKDYDVTVIFPRHFWKKSLSKNLQTIKMLILKTIPYMEKIKLVEKTASLINKKVFRDLDQYDYIYIGYPLYARYIPDTYTGKIIYDCMDNHEALYPDKKRVEKLIFQEKRLIHRCDLLFVSSEVLLHKMDNLAGKTKSILIRNGMLNQEIMDIKKACIKEVYDIGYIGTISKWFDIDTIVQSLEIKKNIRYQLIGPCEVKYQHERIKYYDVIEHNKLGVIVESFDCLIMPFQINDIVSAVDPVKLYEYIAFGKCIISVYYPEIERFSEFVYFYEDTQQYVALLDELMEKGFPPKYSKLQQESFLRENSWEQRYKMIMNEIMSMEN